MSTKKKCIDILNRGDAIAELYNIAQVASKNQVYRLFAIEGKWGAGKTFILDVGKMFDLEKLEEKLEDEIYKEGYGFPCICT